MSLNCSKWCREWLKAAIGKVKSRTAKWTETHVWWEKQNEQQELGTKASMAVFGQVCCRLNFKGVSLESWPLWMQGCSLTTMRLAQQILDHIMVHCWCWLSRGKKLAAELVLTQHEAYLICQAWRTVKLGKLVSSHFSWQYKCDVINAHHVIVRQHEKWNFLVFPNIDILISSFFLHGFVSKQAQLVK